MKTFITVAALFLSSASAHAADYGDRDCNIYVSDAGNVITGGDGNYISATVVVSGDLINKYFQDYEVKINGYENAKPTRIEGKGAFLVFTFDKYRKGVEYHGNSARVEAYITNGVDRLFDNNDNVWLVRAHNWQYSNQRCKMN